MLISQNISTERWVSYIDSLKQANKLIVRDKSSRRPNWTDISNKISCYFLDNSLVLIETNSVSLLDTTYRRYYIKQHSNDLIKVIETHEKYKDTYDKEDYCQTHKDKFGNCDFSLLKIYSETTLIKFGKTSAFELKRDGNVILLSRKLRKEKIQVFKDDYNELQGLIIDRID